MKERDLLPCFRGQIWEQVEVGDEMELQNWLRLCEEESGPVDSVKFRIKFGVRN